MCTPCSVTDMVHIRAMSHCIGISWLYLNGVIASMRELLDMPCDIGSQTGPTQTSRPCYKLLVSLHVVCQDGSSQLLLLGMTTTCANCWEWCQLAANGNACILKTDKIALESITLLLAPHALGAPWMSCSKYMTGLQNNHPLHR